MANQGFKVILNKTKSIKPDIQVGNSKNPFERDKKLFDKIRSRQDSRHSLFSVDNATVEKLTTPLLGCQMSNKSKMTFGKKGSDQSGTVSQLSNG